MRGFGTSDNLFIKWMCLAKERMNQVREHFTCLAIEDRQSGLMVIANNSDGKDYYVVSKTKSF